MAADNRRWCVIDFPEEETVLVIDGDPAQRNAFYIQAIFQPGQRARTGVRPEVQHAAFLRDVSAESLDKYSAIYLFDVDRLDDRARENLEAYVRAGGGLAIFVGPQVNIAFYNSSSIAEGRAVSPAAGPRRHAGRRRRIACPTSKSKRPTIRSFRNWCKARTRWCARCTSSGSCVRTSDSSDAAAAVRILARLRNRAPLAVEKSFGQGA